MRQLLDAVRVDDVGRRLLRAAPTVAHVERTVAHERQPARGVVDLTRTEADVKQNAVDEWRVVVDGVGQVLGSLFDELRALQERRELRKRRHVELDARRKRGAQSERVRSFTRSDLQSA